MKRYFNTEGICNPAIHYMVRLDERLYKIKQLFVDRGKYFSITRGRQYGKTTTLRALKKYLEPDYLVLFLDFQMLGSEAFKDEPTFSKAFTEIFIKAFQNTDSNYKKTYMQDFTQFSQQSENAALRELFTQISNLCQNIRTPIVVIIDEADSAANNQVFVDFLSMLRGYYLDRENSPIFHSVILAGVYDVKNLKLKLRPEENHQYNSPWNIAAKFNINMNFSASEIAAMLQEYEADRHTGMDIPSIAEEIYHYTSGYPYLVSAVCKIADEELPMVRMPDKPLEQSMNSNSESSADSSCVWSREGIAKAVNILLKEDIPLFGSMAKQLDTYKTLRDMIEEILYEGKQIAYSPMEHSVNLGVMFGFLKDEYGHVAITNRIFEMALLNMFIAKEAVKSEAYRYGQQDKNQFIQNGRLDMDLVLEKFVSHFTDIYGDNDEKFLEKYARKFFLLYLKPIINGTGNYYIEAQTRDAGRTDVIVDYLGCQYVVELKIWHGNEYRKRGESQLSEYLDYFHLKKGYMLSFNFNQNKEPGVKVIELNGRTIVEAVV